MREIAHNLASQGRRGDTMLVHMSPKEVGGLQALARSQGTSLTINPNTGLPEAFNLGRLLPMVAGAALTAFSGGTLSPLTIGLMTGGIGALATGSLKEGLMMGLGAAGGAGLAGSMANLAAPAAATAAPAGSVVGSNAVAMGGGSGLTVPASALNTSATSPALFNAGPISNVGLTANTNALQLPSLANAGTVTPSVITPSAAATSSNLTGLDALKQSAIGGGTLPTVSQPVTSVGGPMTLDPALVGRPVMGAETISPSIHGVTLGRATPNLPNAYTLGDPTSTTNLPLNRAIDVARANPPTTLDALTAQAVPPSPEAALRVQPFQPSGAVDYSLAGAAPKPVDIKSLAGPSYADRVLAGGKEAFSSLGSAGDFLSNNKMNLAMAGAPVMFAEPEYAGTPESDAMIRPYTLEIDNTSGLPVSSGGREEERLRYRFIAGTPYKAAQGGEIRYDEGGEVATQSPVDRVYASIDRVQRAAGLGAFQPSQIPASMQAMQTLMPARQTANTSPYQYIPVQSTIERNYGVAMPNPEDSPSYRDIQESEKNKLGSMFSDIGDSLFPNRRDFAKGGNVRKEIDRMSMDPYNFADYRSGRGAYDAAMKNFTQGGLGALPPRFLSGGGDGMSDDIPATIEGKQPARLADGEFVIPADVVSHIGNGSSKAGAKKLHAMMDQVRKKRTGKKKQAPAIKAEKYMPK